MDGYMQRTENKKSKIKQVAFELFLKHGIEKVSLAEIAKGAGVSPVTIYNYFGTKDQLIAKVMTSFLEDEWQQKIELMRSELPFPEKVERMIFESIQWTEKLNLSVMNQVLSNDSEWKTVVETVFSSALTELTQFIEAGKAEGYIDKDIPTNSILIYFNLVKEMKLTSQFKEISSNPLLLGDLTQLIFYGFLKKRPD